jgi:hypothetical protein
MNRVHHGGVSEPLLPDVTSDEGDLGWGDDSPDREGSDREHSDRDDDARFTEERPPHHDRP